MGARTTSQGSREGQRPEVVEAQRARLLEATAEVVAENGLRGASKSQIAECAGVSRTTLAEQFASLDDCLLALLDMVLERAAAQIVKAFERESSWSDGVLAALEGLLVLLDREPLRARVCLLESMTLPPAALQVRALAVGEIARLVDGRVRDELSIERQPPVTMSEATIGAVLGLLRRRVLSGVAPPFLALLGELAETVVAPYLGPSAAARAASTGKARAQALLNQDASPPSELEVPSMLRHANAHRMRACVQYLADHSGSSNRAIGAAIGVSHAGQVSRLLARLHEAGLLEKEEGGAGRPNDWRLSPYGVEVAQALSRW